MFMLGIMIGSFVSAFVVYRIERFTFGRYKNIKKDLDKLDWLRENGLKLMRKEMAETRYNSMYKVNKKLESLYRYETGDKMEFYTQTLSDLYYRYTSKLYLTVINKLYSIDADYYDLPEANKIRFKNLSIRQPHQHKQNKSGMGNVYSMLYDRLCIYIPSFRIIDKWDFDGVCKYIGNTQNIGEWR